MGFRFTVGRILLGLLLILQGVLIMQSGYKDQLQTLRDLRSYLNHTYGRQEGTLSGKLALLVGGSYTDQTLSMLVYVQALLMIVSGALIIANVRVGGLILTLGMIGIMATRDNPLLANNEQLWRHHFMNMLKDVAVAGIGILIFNRRLSIRHRKQQVAGEDRRQQHIAF
jgi:hypothetical protein